MARKNNLHVSCLSQKVACSLIGFFILVFILYVASLRFDQVETFNIFSAIIGFYFAIVIGHIFISITICKLWLAATGEKRDPKSPFDSSAIIGWVERALYFSALMLDKPEAIGVWLALKTSGRFWGEGPNQEKVGETSARDIFQIYLIGTALSLGYATVGWKIAEWLPENRTYSICLVVALCIGNFILCRNIKSLAPKNSF
ncbi:MAG: hypothetical protein XD72_2145 [Methanothrix harundinacea]|jgi:phosphate/sulfate permease|uniref:Uncharacterized protein n=1 Tax=Methanothrix harundinacea TaxID=301375 RepID=A0A101FS60_9EURY|nr:MAG: hypothetical protein XD72_2145 [Methanothrix harundinacea]